MCLKQFLEHFVKSFSFLLVFLSKQSFRRRRQKALFFLRQRCRWCFAEYDLNYFLSFIKFKVDILPKRGIKSLMDMFKHILHQNIWTMAWDLGIGSGCGIGHGILVSESAISVVSSYREYQVLFLVYQVILAVSVLRKISVSCDISNLDWTIH